MIGAVEAQFSGTRLGKIEVCGVNLIQVSQPVPISGKESTHGIEVFKSGGLPSFKPRLLGTQVLGVI